MATKVEQINAVSRGMLESEAKKIVLDHFHAVYTERNVDKSLVHVSEGIRWIGSRECYVAHDIGEFRHLLGKELGTLPSGCVIEVVASDSVMLSEECISVTGELDIRIPHPTQLVYRRLRFSTMLYLEDGEYMIVSHHTALTSDGIADYESKLVNGESIRLLAQNLKRQSQYDSLTGLYILEAFKERVRDELKENPDGQYVIFCTNIQHFELVNNLYGLKRADRLLSELSTMLTMLDKEVKVCCRSVADHFLVFMEYNGKEQLEQELKKLCEDFHHIATEKYSDALPKLGVGVYVITDNGEDVDKMVENANATRKALGVHKGFEVVFYDSRIFKKLEKMKEIETTMESALENGEFKVYIQPKYSLENNHIVGAEALCRWIRDDGTMVYPDEFIPVFEEDGFIENIDFYMLEKVCEMIERRANEGKRCVAVSINQSRVLLQDSQYVSKVASVICRYKIPSEFIELELTERIFQDDLSGFAEMMEELKKYGIRWSIDDFGTGYSSLNLLKELPVDILKIDKSFLDETETSDMSRIIIRKTVELAQELNKNVVCEGVETESQADYLRDIRCDMAQGFLYARPMPMSDFEILLDKEMLP